MGSDYPITRHGRVNRHRRRLSSAVFSGCLLLGLTGPVLAEAQNANRKPADEPKRDNRIDTREKPEQQNVKPDRFVPVEKIKADSAIAFPVDI